MRELSRAGNDALLRSKLLDVWSLIQARQGCAFSHDLILSLSLSISLFLSLSLHQPEADCTLKQTALVETGFGGYATMP